MKLVVSDAAKTDLKSIAEYTLREWGLQQKARYLRLLRANFKRILKNPNLGIGRDEISPGYRSLPAGRHVIYYRGVQTHIEIVRVLHGSMDAQRHLERPTTED